MPTGLSKRDEAAAWDAGQKVVETHRRLSAWLRSGLSLAEIDDFVAATLDELEAPSCFLGYRVPRLPAFNSHACLSVNECIVHGTRDYFHRPIEAGDVLKIDIGVRYKGWIGDAARTYVFGEMSPEVRALTDAGKESIIRGIEAMQAGRPLIEWARAVQGYVEEECGLHLVRGLGGHGYGRQLHSPPFVSNVVPEHPAEWPEAGSRWRPGMLVAVEPMLAAGTHLTKATAGEWPVFTADGSQSVHYEHDVLITKSGPRLMTEGLDEVEDVITR